MHSRKIILISGFGNACGHFWTLLSQQGSLLLFKSSYPLLQRKEKTIYKTKKDSYQKLSFLWCRKAIQIRTISL